VLGKNTAKVILYYLHDFYFGSYILHAVFSEHTCSSLYVVVRPSVCRLSVTFVRPIQAIEIFGNISTPFGTLSNADLSVKILRRSSPGEPLRWGLNARMVAKYSDFGPFQDYISETVQNIR